MLTNRAMLEILGLVEEEECGGQSLTSFTAQNCREDVIREMSKFDKIF